MNTETTVNAAEWLNIQNELKRQVDKNLMLESELAKYKAAAVVGGYADPTNHFISTTTCGVNHEH